MMGNASAKDNFYLKTRMSLQDTLALFFIVKNVQSNNNTEYYLPWLVELLSDLLDVERCSIFLYDRQKDELYCKVITGRLKEVVSFKRTNNSNILCQAFNQGECLFIKNANNSD